jgi:hypothetical protein
MAGSRPFSDGCSPSDLDGACHSDPAGLVCFCVRPHAKFVEVGLCSNCIYFRVFLTLPVRSAYRLGCLFARVIEQDGRERQSRSTSTANRVSLVRSSAAGQPGELARITGERAEALTQQTATSELLAINSSGVAELEPILRAILEKAKPSISGALAAAYSHAELGEKDLRLGSVLVFCNGVSISGLDKSMSNQAIESPPFICIQIFGALHAPSANDVAKDRQFLVVDDDAFCHLTAPTTFNRPPKNYSRAFGPHRKCHGSHQFVR